MVTSCHHLLCCNNTTEEDNNTLPSSSSLQHHHRKRRQHIVVIFFFSNTKKTKHTRKQPKKNQKKGGSLPSSSHFTLSLLAPAFALPLLPFCFKHFLLTSFSSQVEEKEKKPQNFFFKCKEGNELSFKLLLYPFTFGSHLYPPISTPLFQTLSPDILFF